MTATPVPGAGLAWWRGAAAQRRHRLGFGQGKPQRGHELILAGWWRVLGLCGRGLA